LGELGGVAAAALLGTTGSASAFNQLADGPSSAAGPLAVMLGGLILLGYSYSRLSPANAVFLAVSLSAAAGWLPTGWPRHSGWRTALRAAPAARNTDPRPSGSSCRRARSVRGTRQIPGGCSGPQRCNPGTRCWLGWLVWCPWPACSVLFCSGNGSSPRTGDASPRGEVKTTVESGRRAPTVSERLQVFTHSETLSSTGHSGCAGGHQTRLMNTPLTVPLTHHWLAAPAGRTGARCGARPGRPDLRILVSCIGPGWIGIRPGPESPVRSTK